MWKDDYEYCPSEFVNNCFAIRVSTRLIVDKAAGVRGPVEDLAETFAHIRPKLVEPSLLARSSRRQLLVLVTLLLLLLLLLQQQLLLLLLLSRVRLVVVVSSVGRCR